MIESIETGTSRSLRAIGQAVCTAVLRVASGGAEAKLSVNGQDVALITRLHSQPQRTEDSEWGTGDSVQPEAERAANAPKRLVKMDLAPRERVPWALGYRIGLEGIFTSRTWVCDLLDIAEWMTPAEQAALVDANADEFERWVYTGLLAAELESRVRENRGT